jgi:P27 family predicted phage terminase small subunit
MAKARKAPSRSNATTRRTKRSTRPAIVEQLRKEAKDYYDLVIEEVQKDIKKEHDVNTVITLVVEYHKYLTAADVILTQDIFVQNEYTKVYSVHPAVNMQKQCIASMQGIWKALGLSPEARLDFDKKKGTKKIEGNKKPNAGISGHSVVKS